MGTEAETVERVGHLVTAAGATLKDKRRPIKVIGRDGAVKKTIPHVEVIEGLLHHEGISGELQAGVRPKTVLCEVCKCVVEVRRVGLIPKACPKHRQSKLCPRGCGRAVAHRAKSCNECKTPDEKSFALRCARLVLTTEKRSAIAVEVNNRRTPEQRSDAMRKANAARTHEQRSAISRKASATMTPEERSERARKANAKRTPGQRSETMRMWQSARTPAERDEAHRKAWETRRAKQAAKG